ncbi:hypothetical protein EJB05_15804, partial [Eragrostis curvula]
WTFLSNSTFGANLAKISASFPANASASGGFVKGSFGAASDTVYALALCRGDTAAADCTACLDVAFRIAKDLCGNSNDERCQVRPSDLNILDLSANQPTSQKWDDMGDDIADPIFLGRAVLTETETSASSSLVLCRRFCTKLPCWQRTTRPGASAPQPWMSAEPRRRRSTRWRNARRIFQTMPASHVSRTLSLKIRLVSSGRGGKADGFLEFGVRSRIRPPTSHQYFHKVS